MIITIAAISVAALFTFNETDSIATQSIGLQSAQAVSGVIHDIEMEVVAMPDGMYAYRMMSYNISGEDENRNLMDEGVYTQKPSIPGPTIVLTEGDQAIVTLTNNACDSKFLEGDVGPAEIFNVGMHVHGVHYDISDDATYERVNMSETSAASCDGESVMYKWDAGLGTQGTWPYHDHTFAQNEVGAEDVGLFGVVIVNPANGKVNGLVDANNGKIKKVDVDDIEKEFVLWMVSSEVLGRSVFYGMEIDNGNGGKQTPLWINPTLYATEGDNVRYHVLGIGDETHAFHLHGHRWVEAQGGTQDIIDVKEITPLQRHTFLITASDNENSIDDTEGWMYHCHFFNHMQQGMSGMMVVLPEEHKIDEMPPVGATFTISDEPGLWFKTLDAGVLDELDEFVEKSLELPVQFFSKPGTGFSPNWLGLISPHDFSNTEGRSLAILSSDTPSTVLFTMKDSQTKHTITNLIWPAGAQLLTVDGDYENLGGIDINLSVRGSSFLTDSQGRPAMLQDPGLYVFVCKIHPYMFSAVIVDDPNTKLEDVELLPILLPGKTTDVPILDLSEETTILTRSLTKTLMSDGDLLFEHPSELPDYISTLPSLHPITTGLVKTFYVASDPNNWRDYNESNWVVSLPPVPVTNNVETCEIIGEGEDAEEICELETVVNLSILDSVTPNTDEISNPDTRGDGEVWVNTQFEKTINKNHLGTPQDKPGTITVVDATNWDVERKIALPEINMNHPHNLWANAEQDTIYQTQWFGTDMVAIDRYTGEMIKEVFVGQSPSHVMTAPGVEDNAGNIYLAMNGEEQVTELDPVTLDVTRQFSTGTASHPHGHWINTDGTIMVTPNFFTSESSIIDLVDPSKTQNVQVGFTPIATGMMPDGSKYYTADFLGNSYSVVDISDIDNPQVTSIDIFNHGFDDIDPMGIPVQTPVSPDGKHMVTATVLSHKITVVDTEEDKLVAILDCDPGCHGVQWGAKEGGGYYAYVSNKFSNALIVVDPKPGNDTNDDGFTKVDGSDAVVAGKILLSKQSGTEIDDKIIGYAGMGGQGVLAVPNVYAGWIQQTVTTCGLGNCSPEIVGFLADLEPSQKAP
jgi:FtsP/CotA-like multicopper oxidase with cupredoxin domain